MIRKPINDYDIDYAKWKSWESESGFGYLPRHHAAMFSAEIKKTKRSNYVDVLEVGFGSGTFLKYAKGRGWSVTGVEINPVLISAAQKAGYRVYSDMDNVADQSQDLVVAFDVLEHIAESDLLAFVGALIGKLRPGGVFIARFPNGDSCLGLPWQNGDFTHQIAIGTGKVEFIAKSLDLKIGYIGGQAEPIFCGSFPHVCHRLFANPLKVFLEKIFGFLFFPGSRVTLMSSNLVVILHK